MTLVAHRSRLSTILIDAPSGEVGAVAAFWSQALGVPMQVLGWGVRTALLAAALVVAWRPSAIAAAWRDRAAPTPENHGDA